MRAVAAALVVLVGAMSALPMASGQGSTVTRCDPASCDPILANRGQVKSGDEPVRVILYAHMRDLLQRSPLNTQPPGPQESTLSGGFLMPTVGAGDVLVGFRNNEFLWFLSPGPVEYLDGGKWRVHQQRGLGAPFEFASGETTLFFYASPGRSATGGQEPYAMPAVGVYAKIIYSGKGSADAGLIVAEGDTGTGYGDLGPEGAAGSTVMVSAPGQDPVYEFRVPMDVLRPRLIPPDRDASEAPRHLLVEVVLYQLHTEAAVFTESGWRVRGGPDFPPRLVVDLAEPLRTESSHMFKAQTGEDRRLGFAWAVESTLGRYDVDAESVRIQVDGPGALSPSLARVDNRLDHDGMYDPVGFLWQHNLTQEPLADGVYHVDASVLNRQGTYMVNWSQSFEVRGGEPDVESLGPTSWEGSAAGLPGTVTAVILAAAAAVVGWARSRRR